jgi:hypothetical protein
MEHRNNPSKMFSMKRIAFLISICVCSSTLSIFGQANVASTPYEFLWTFRGSCYQTNAEGKILSTAVTEKTLLRDKAAAVGITDTSHMAVVYHVNGSSFGDTVDIVNVTNGAVLDTLFGYYFGEDQSLGRMALTNSMQTEVRRIDYIYTSQNSHSMGAAFTTKRYSTNHNGVVKTRIDGPIHWLVTPQGNEGVKVYSGTFMIGKPLF